jgi:hypothetical protein
LTAALAALTFTATLTRTLPCYLALTTAIALALRRLALACALALTFTSALPLALTLALTLPLPRRLAAALLAGTRPSNARGTQHAIRYCASRATAFASTPFTVFFFADKTSIDISARGSGGTNHDALNHVKTPVFAR